MNLDELMALWKSQDVAPLHRMNETLLKQALRKDGAKLLAERRWERRREYFGAAVCVGLIVGFFISQMIENNVLTAWDYAIPVVILITALLSGSAMHVRHRTQTVREQRFGESLRDQINRQISQLDFWATRLSRARVWGEALLTAVVFTALMFAWWRITDRPFSGARLITIFVGLCGSFIWLAVTFWRSHRRLQREVLPRRHRLENLLKEIDAQ